VNFISGWKNIFSLSLENQGSANHPHNIDGNGVRYFWSFSFRFVVSFVHMASISRLRTGWSHFSVATCREGDKNIFRKLHYPHSSGAKINAASCQRKSERIRLLFMVNARRILLWWPRAMKCLTSCYAIIDIFRSDMDRRVVQLYLIPMRSIIPICLVNDLVFEQNSTISKAILINIRSSTQ